MLPEIFLYMTADALPLARRSGLRGDAVALWSRATRRRRDWAEHEANCRAVVARATDQVARRDHVLVLGSGLLRDVNLGDLACTFSTVTLVDAVHLLPARRAAHRAGARIRRVDLTGILDWRDGKPRVRTDPVPLLSDSTPDLVISANVLSQLPMAVAAQMGGKASRPGPPAGLPSQVVRWHLEDLGRLGCPVCLLTDVSYRVVDRDGRTREEHDLLYGHALPEPDAAWDWPVAPLGETGRDRAVIHRVHAYIGRPRALLPDT